MITDGVASVIIPYYNNGQILECIDSVLAQDYPSIELIVADDGSDVDRSAELSAYIAANKKANIVSCSVIRSPENRGTVRNINAGLRKAAGDPIFTLAGDDVFYDAHVLTDWVAAFRNGNPDVVIGLRSVCDESLAHEFAVSPGKRQAALLRSGSGKKIWKELCRENFIFGCATARSAACVEKYGLIPECYKLIEDYPMNLRWARCGAKIAFLDRIVVRHRKGGGSYALNVSEEYIRDTRMISDREIIPYVRQKRFWKRHCEHRIRLRVREMRYLKLRKRNGSLLWNLLCHLMFPEIILKYVQTQTYKIRRRLRR